jgi:aminotransferase
VRDPLNKIITEIPPSGIRKFFDIVSEMKDAISLGVGEPDFDTPWHIREEGIYSLERGRTFYTSNAGIPALRAEISSYLDRRFGLTYDPKDEVLVTVGGSEAIDVALRAMVDPGDEVIIPQPSYVSYVPCAVLAGATPVICELQEADEFKLTPQSLTAHITPHTKILILPFPNNPTGSVLTADELRAIAKICIEKDIFVITDEIYAELSYGLHHTSIASLPGMRERTVVINGFSKSYAMTGWRLGYAVGPEVILSQMTKIHQFAIMCAPTNSQYAAIEALKNGDADVEHMRDEYNMRRRFVVKTLREIGFDCFEPFGAFYAFPSIKKWNCTSDDFSTDLLKAQKVAVVAGTAFGACGEGFLRISYAYSIENLKVAFERIEKYIREQL